MPPAPCRGGEPRSPRQVIAGHPAHPVGHHLPRDAPEVRGGQPAPDARRPGQGAARHAAADSAARVAAAAVLAWPGGANPRPRSRPAGPVRTAGSAATRPGRRAGRAARGAARAATPTPTGLPDGHGYAASRRRRRRRQAKPGPARPRLGCPRLLPARFSRGVLIGIGVLVVAAITAFMLWPISGSPNGHPHPGRSTPLTSVTQLRPLRAQGFDPLTSASADPTNEESQDAKLRDRRQHADRLELAVVRQRRSSASSRRARAS